MPVWSGVPVPITRMLGQVDQDDPTNLPAGCAGTCLNIDFTRDSTGGALSPATRAGNNMIMRGAPSPGTGLWDFQYEPESATDPGIWNNRYGPGPINNQRVNRFTLSGILEYESPPGTGRMTPAPAGMFALPVNSHRIDAQAGNIQWSAYTDLLNPTAGMSGWNPKTLTLDPLGMKPYGWQWLPNTTVVYQNEVACPSNQNSGPQGNGHTYQAQNAGATGPNEPAWPLTEGGTVLEVLSAAQLAKGLVPVLWKELTMVIANRLPDTPPAPTLALVNGGGTFPIGQTVYIALASVNGMGQTTLGAVASITTTAANQGVNVTIPANYATSPGWLTQLVAPYAVLGAAIYEFDQPSGGSAPPLTAFCATPPAYTAAGATYLVTSSYVGVGGPAQTVNTARITPGQLATPSEEAPLTRVPAGGAFPAGRDVWVRLSFSNANGETPVGPSNSVINTLLNDAVTADLTTLADVKQYPQLQIVNVYEADVPTGTAEPPISSYALVQVSAVGDTVTITASATGQNPVTVNGTGPGGNVVADTADGGVNDTQGYRYAVPCWMNRNETVSGFTQAAVSKYIVDENGWEIAVFNVAIGPPNVIGRPINWSVADSTQEGPFWWIGLVDTQIPTQNLVYPKSYLSDGITIVPTMILDNVTTSATFNFTDEFLDDQNDTTDRLRVTAPPQAAWIGYLKSCDRLAVVAPGYQSGVVLSLGKDYESFYGDNSPLPIVSTSGERCWGIVEFRNQIYAMRERSGLVVTPGEGDPNSWDVKERWDEVGPCGPRAFDACGQFIVFVHRTGLYKYDGTGAPDMMIKEIPRKWGSIDWTRATTICCTIDVDTHTVRLQVPVGRNGRKEFCLSYLEGWLDPIHFSSFKDTEISQEAARRWAFNNFDSYICKRIYRTVPNPPPLPLAPDGTSQTGSDFYVSQLAYTTTDPSGIVNARTPGVYNDNGAGIDSKYQTISAKAMQKMCKPEGVSTNAVGFGRLNSAFIAGRRRIDDQKGPAHLVPMQPIELSPNSGGTFSRRAPRTNLDEFWGVVYDNGAVPDAWFSIKNLTPYVIPVKAARSAGDNGK
jgi:hypothetical protein